MCLDAPALPGRGPRGGVNYARAREAHPPRERRRHLGHVSRRGQQAVYAVRVRTRTRPPSGLSGSISSSSRRSRERRATRRAAPTSTAVTLPDRWRAARERGDVLVDLAREARRRDLGVRRRERVAQIAHVALVHALQQRLELGVARGLRGAVVDDEQNLELRRSRVPARRATIIRICYTGGGGGYGGRATDGQYTTPLFSPPPVMWWTSVVKQASVRVGYSMWSA